MSIIYLYSYYWESLTFSKRPTNLSTGQFLASYNSHITHLWSLISLNFRTSCCSIEIRGLIAIACVASIILILKGIATFYSFFKVNTVLSIERPMYYAKVIWNTDELVLLQWLRSDVLNLECIQQIIPIIFYNFEDAVTCFKKNMSYHVCLIVAR